MTESKLHLDVIDVASPCSADWDQMQGTDRVRFCGECKLNVYNLSEMHRSEAEDLVIKHEGRLCVRFFRRSDGTLLTRDCPVGLWAARRRVARMIAGIAALVGFIVLGGWWSRSGWAHTWASSPSRLPDPLARLVSWIEPPPITGVMAMGDYCAPTPPITPTTAGGAMPSQPLDGAGETQ